MPNLPRRLFDSLASALRGRVSRRAPLLLEIDDVAAYRRPAGRRVGDPARASGSDEASSLMPCNA